MKTNIYSLKTINIFLSTSVINYFGSFRIKNLEILSTHLLLIQNENENINSRRILINSNYKYNNSININRRQKSFQAAM